MASSFAAAAQRATQAVLARLADSELVINGAATVPAIWSDPHVTAIDALDATVPTATIGAQAFPGLQRGDRVVRAGAVYRVIGIEPDGLGLVRLRLELWD